MRMPPNIYKYYFVGFARSFIPAYVVERLYWSQRGMTVKMVIYTEIIYAVTLLLFELPTGYFADRCGRKRSLVLSEALACFEFLILVFAHHFWQFALMVVIAAISQSFSSGAKNALLYDSLLSAGMEQDYERALVRLNVVDLAATILAAIGGGLLASRFGYLCNYYISEGATLVSLLFTLTLTEPPVQLPQDEAPRPSWGDVRRTIIHLIQHQRAMLPVLTAGMVSGAAIGLVDEFWQLVLQAQGVSVKIFGFYSAALFLFRIPGNLIASTLTGKVRYRIILPTVCTIIAVNFLGLALARNMTGLLAMLFIGTFSAAMEPLTTGYLHHRVDSSVRATIDSLQSFGLNVVLAVMGLGFGLFSTILTVYGGYGFIAVVCGCYAAYLGLISRRILD